VKRAIRIHRRDFAAIIALLLGAIAVTGYIFAHQPSFTFLHSYYSVKAEFASAAAVTAGQGQTVDIAGVQVGQVGGVTLHNGRAVVTMNMFKQYAPIYRNATVLLRPRTPLKDMYLELDPGTKSAGAIPAGGTLAAGATNPDVDFSQILSSLDTDTCCCCSPAGLRRSETRDLAARSQALPRSPTCAGCSSASRP